MKQVSSGALSVSLLLAATPAFAQSGQVTLFGVLDTNVARYSASGAASVTRVGVDGLSSTRWGIRGEEIIGSDLRAAFWLEGGYRTDTGAIGNTNLDNRPTGNGSGVFGRRVTLSLSGAWGEARFGRDFTPVALNVGDFSLYGPTSTGHVGALSYPLFASVTHVRISNGLSYLSPVVAGLHAQAAYAPSETAGNADGRYMGARVTYRSGALLLGAGAARTRYLAGDQQHTTAGARYDAGAFRVMALYTKHRKAAIEHDTVHLGLTAQIGGNEWRVGASDARVKGGNGARQFMLGVIHPLSKRTAVYADLSQVDNKGSGREFGVVDGPKPATPGGESSAFEAGIRHSF